MLLICCTTVYVSHAYSAYRRQLQYCYLGIVLLCPAFFVHDYLHLCYDSIGYHILFLIVFAHDHLEYIVAGVLSGVLVNFHRTYWLVVPFVLASLLARSLRGHFTSELGPRRLLCFCYDASQLFMAFVASYLVVAAPWFAKADDFWSGLHSVAVTPLRNTLVGFFHCRTIC